MRPDLHGPIPVVSCAPILVSSLLQSETEGFRASTRSPSTAPVCPGPSLPEERPRAERSV